MRTSRLRAWTIAWAVVLLWPCAAANADSIENEAAKFLPSGATFAREPQFRLGGGTTMDSVVAAGSIARWGGRDLAFVYQTAGNLVLRVVIANPGPPKEFDARLPGSFVSGSSSFPGLLLKDVTGGGVQQVLVQTSEGASVGTYLSVFSLGSEGLNNLVSTISLTEA